MRLVVHDYEDGDRYAYVTTNDGDFVRDVSGRRKPGARIKAEIEVAFDDNDEGRAAAEGSLRDALGWVATEAAPGA
jgi:hypothetical protein